MNESRPWGNFEILYNNNDFKIKKLIVKPLQKLSLQKHFHRNEYWIVINGNGQAQIENDFIDLYPGKVITILKEQKHRLINHHNQDLLVLVEVQTGDYFGEDDIVRYEDDYNRVI